jgi:hypothetical protein
MASKAGVVFAIRKVTIMTTSTLLLTATGALVALAAVPFALPAARVVERRRVIAAAPDAIHALLASNSGYQRFNPWRDQDANLKIELFGPSAGVGSGFHFDGAGTKGKQTVVAVEQDRSVACEIDMGAMGKSTHRFLLAPSAGGTDVTWRMESAFGMNPIGRVFGLFMEKMLGPVCERGLANLDRAVKAA